VALVSGQVVQGLDSTFFDPVLEQVGLGPVERSHLSHTIAEVRQTVDAIGPRCRQILGALQETASGIRETADTVRPAVETTVRRIDEAAPRVEEALRKLDALIAGANGAIAENRADVRATLASLKDLSAIAQQIAVADRPKLEALLVGLDGTRTRADHLLYQADLLTGQGLQIVTQHRADLERTLANVRDASGWGDRLVQKLYGNPFYLSPLYKPTPEDVHAQEVYDATQTFLAGARELHDAIKTLGTLRAVPMTPTDRQTFDQLFQRAVGLEQQLGQTSQRLAEGLRTDGHRGKVR
jgi:phospholipid/cholesterol/gamma-HCH transport system substrate-binding protein